MPKKPPNGTSIRFRPELAVAVDNCVAQERARRPGQTVRRADVIRMLLVEALQARGVPIPLAPID